MSDDGKILFFSKLCIGTYDDDDDDDDDDMLY